MLTTSYPRFHGDGAGIFVYDLAEHISQKGVDVTVLAPHQAGCNLRENQGNIFVRRYRYWRPERYQSLCYGSGIVKNLRSNPFTLIQVPPLLFSQFIAIAQIVKKEKVDIIHAHWSFPQGLMGLICKFIYNIPYIVTVHGSDIHGLNYPILSSLNRLILHHAAACTANSRETASATQRLSGLKNLHIVPMGVNTKFFKEDDTRSGRDKEKDEETIILFVGRLIDIKGVNYLLGAMPDVIRMFPQAKLIIAGEGPERARLEKMSFDLGIQGHVVFGGEVDHNALLKYYMMADVFVLPSCINNAGETEGLGVVLLEAMACGVPVVGSNVGGIPHIIKDGITGLLANQKDTASLACKIIELLGNPTLRENLKLNAKNLIDREYSWDVIVSKFLNIYTDITNFHAL